MFSVQLFSKSAVDFNYFFTDARAFWVTSPAKTQDDRLYAPGIVRQR